MNLRKKFWEWLSWGKDLEKAPDIPIGEQSVPKILPSDAERTSILKAEILKRVEQGFTLMVEQQFVAILSLPRRRGVFLYFLVNVPFLLLFGYFWILFFLIWTVVLLNRVLNKTHDTYRLEVSPDGSVAFGNSSSFLKNNRWDKH